MDVARRLQQKVHGVRGAAGMWLLMHRLPPWLRRPASHLVAGTGPARALGLGSLTAPQLAEVLQTDEARALVDRSAVLPAPATAWNFVDDDRLRPALIRRLRDSVPPEWSQAIHDACVLNRAAGAEQRASALLIATDLAGRLGPRHERAIFAECVKLLSAPPDPYSRPTGQLAGAAVQAAAAILAVDASLDADAADAVKGGKAPLMRDAVTSALRASAEEDDARRFLFYVDRLRLASEQLVRFAEDCDARKSAADPLLTTEVRRPSLATRARARVFGPLRAGLPFLIGPALAAGLAVGGAHVDGKLTSVSVGSGVAIGAIAVLAAVHVLSVQLAAGSLPSPIARAAVAPTGIRTAYGIGVAMLAVSLLESIRPPLSWHPGAVSAVLLVLLVVSIIAVTVRALRNLSPAATSSSAASRAVPKALGAGRDIAEFTAQRTAVEEVVETEAYLRTHMSADETVRRQVLVAAHAGFLEVDAGMLESLGRRKRWKDGDLRLDLLVDAGAPLTTGTEYASIVPTPRASLEGDEYSAAAGAFRVTPRPRVEDMTELTVALFDEMLALRAGGDAAGAHHVQDRLVVLLRLHVVAARGDQWREPGNPLSPMVTTVVKRALRGVAASATEESRELCIGVLRVLLKLAGPSDPVIGIVALRAVTSTPPSLSQLTVLYEAGKCAIALGSDSDLAPVQGALHKLIGGSDDPSRYADETAARLVQYAAIADPLNSRRAWSRYREAATAATAPDLTSNFVRVGAAALRVGNLSLAVETALALPPGTELQKLRATVHQRDRAERENLLSRLFGRLLGEDAEAKLDRFIDAAEVFRES